MNSQSSHYYEAMAVSRTATFSPGRSQEHPDLKKKIIYNN